MITVVGLGPSVKERLSKGAYRAIRCAPFIFVRTERHPVIQELISEGVTVKSLDHFYDSSPTFEDVYANIAKYLLEEASRGDAVYAVPGHPLVGESAVSILLREAKKAGVELKIIGSQSFIEVTLEALGLVIDSGLKIIDALSMDNIAAAKDCGTLIYQVYGQDIASEVKLKLMESYPDDYEIFVVQQAGSPSQEVRRIALHELDRFDCDHLTSVFVPTGKL